jgi:fructose-1-phosphate kinase PfkB-like protein
VSILSICLNPTIQKILRFPSVVQGAVNRTDEHYLYASGKGINATRVLTQLGKKALHLTQLGGVMRPLFLSLCTQDGLSVEWTESESEIRFCYTVLTDSGVTELIEESKKVGASAQERLLEKYDLLLGAQDFFCMIISGTKAAGFSDTLIPLMVRKAKEKGINVILDIKGKDLIESLPYAPDIIKPNLFEFASTFAPHLVRGNESIADNTQEQIKSIALDIVKKYGCRIILTNGSRKIFAAEKDNFFEIEIKTVKAVNTTGCGDAFTAGLASALADGADFRGAINEGIRCGALNAGFIKPGVIRDAL